MLTLASSDRRIPLRLHSTRGTRRVGDSASPLRFSDLRQPLRLPPRSLASAFKNCLQPPPPTSASGLRLQPSASVGLCLRAKRIELELALLVRDDITFKDPLNTFSGISNYKLIFWALRFHGKILFRDISLDVLRVWQPSETIILIRWNLTGVPRVPWEAKGQFQGTSRYKLDRHGKIYEHKVDNLAFNFPQRLKPAASVLDLVAACPASPNPTFLWGPVESPSCSWVELYRAVKETLDREGSMIHHNCLATCS
ncbi:hypothetical protein STAS_13980 [Striga asiatica]|uniref:Uncharacterized protein n=1 Tax=Striga asiatica TaxID=4170 RepID=A0A5A7PZK7_STRAF|nr:hypothetical protein STAS_13980 [Striga asiatica]